MLGGMVASVTSHLRKPPPAAVPVAVEDAVEGLVYLIAGVAGLSASLFQGRSVTRSADVVAAAVPIVAAILILLTNRIRRRVYPILPAGLPLASGREAAVRTVRANALLACAVAWVVTGPTWPGAFCAAFGLALLASAGLAARRSASRRGRLWYWRPDLAMYQTP